ncbi:hypothetical protein M514_26441 [Trichuris suis]|uniref:DDE-1 domain-containing protein n=1 Tax=Trichuris suis TaxID=68888 RepID=A0A085MVZ0_9BILA|nr:hypothetical protein M514_26441 [Trichuris suis]
MAAESWTLLKQATLRGSWNKLLVRRGPATHAGDWNADSGVNREVEEIMDTLRSTSICEECERADVESWLASDEEDRGLQTMDDEEILEFISREPAETEEEPQYGDDEEKERPVAPSDSEAFRCAEVLMKWYEGQEESVPQRLLCLKKYS